MKTRTSRFLGVTAAITAMTASLPLAVTAYADPPPQPPPVNSTPDPQGSGCDAVKKSLPDGALKAMPTKPVSAALASIPSISTFNAAISGGFNPAVNITSVLDNGPYVVFAPTNDAFAAMDQTKLAELKANPAELTSFDYYHVFLGVLGNDTVKGQRPTQQGTQIKVTGDGDNIKINDSAKMLCGAIVASNARIYIIDTVLDMSQAPTPVGASSSTDTSSTSTSTSTTSSSTESSSTTSSTSSSTESAPSSSSTTTTTSTQR